MNPEPPAAIEPPSVPRWRPLDARQRRVLGVLIEKAKTTPENYPLTLNALRSGCNQKNNRAPLMQLEEPQIEEALDGLRELGAVALVQGSGRVDRYRHLAYDWLGVEKTELAVMAELLLRGAQTVGELRGRAARMEPIKDLSELTPILDALQAKSLVEYLTPPGRGSIVTHTLYLDQEMEKIRREAGAQQHVATGGSPVAARFPTGEPPVASAQSEQLDQLREEITAVKQELAAVRNELTAAVEQLRRQLDELSRQLGN